jgi:hypothetical protein
MFESAIIRKHAEGEVSVDAGIIAETLLFYQNVHVLADRGVISSLLQVMGPGELLDLIDSSALSLTYIPDIFGVKTDTNNDIAVHQFCAIRLHADQKKRRIHPSDDVALIVDHVLGKSRDSRRVTKGLLSRVRFRDVDKCLIGGKPIQANAQNDIYNPRFLKGALQDILDVLVPEFPLPENWKFEIVPADPEFLVGTDLDFAKINCAYHERVPPTHSTITPAFLLGFVLQAKADAYFAADYMAEMVTSPISSRIINRSVSQVLDKRERNLAQLEMFQNVLLEGAPTVREAINSGERSFEDFIKLLGRAQRFKVWLGGRNPDGELLREYHKAITADNWFNRLPSKSIRFLLATLGGIGAEALFPTGGIGMAAGPGLGAIDSLLLDRILKGWKPNQFVEGELRKFTSGA